MSESVDGLKQRLVGAFVILSLAIIFVPMIFDKPHRERSTAIELVPPKPQQRSVVISKPVDIELPERTSKNKVERTIIPVASDVRDGAEVKRDANSKAEDVSDVETGDRNVASQGSKADDKQLSGERSKSTEVYSNVWMVQLGTFTKSDNAYRLRDSIREKGFDSHTKTIASGAVRVFAGPFVTKKEALRIKKKLDSTFKLNSLVLFFDS